MSINNVSAISDGIKYLNGLPVQEQKSSITSDIKASVCSPINAVFGGLQVKDSLKDTFEVSSIKELKPALQNLGEVQMGQTVGASGAIRSTSLTEQFKNAVDKFVKKADAKAAAKAAKNAANALPEVSSATTQLATVGDDAVKAASKTGIFGKIGSAFKAVGNVVKSGVSKIGSAIANTGPGKAISKALGKFAETGAGKALGKVGKVMKGTGAVGMMVFDGIFSIFTDVIPAFKQGGVESGVKQIGKSAVKVASTGLGWAGGTVAASAIGAAIGSVFPGVGTVVGGAIGQFIGGFLGSALANGVAKKITGKSEVEKLQEKQVQDAAKEIANDPASMTELGQQLALKVQSDIENGTVTEDTERIAQLINSGAFNTATYPTTNPYTTYPTTNPTSPTTSNGMNYWTQMAQRAAQGDTSIYNISEERLQRAFNNVNTATQAAQVDKQQQVVNYF